MFDHSIMVTHSYINAALKYYKNSKGSEASYDDSKKDYFCTELYYKKHYFF